MIPRLRLKYRDLLFGSGVPHMTESLLIQTDSHRQLLAVLVFFYDAPTPSGVFDDFLAIPLPKGMSRQHHIPVLFKARVFLRPTAFG
jgi:hypothetical protein